MNTAEADLDLPNLKGVSLYHFALTFDQEKCLVVKDLYSVVGTRVIYDGEIGERGHGIAWSACGPSLVKGKVPVIKVVGDLQFRLVVPDHDITSKTYLDNVAGFLEGAAPAEDLFLDMKITSRTQTELPTPGEAHTPSAQKPVRILWQKELGRGAFAVVKYVWDVTSRAEYALKEPLPKTRGDWEQEARILKSISHDNIVALKHAVFDPGPQLYFEYVKGGSLDCYKCTTPFQRGQGTIQLLDGLAYIHGKLFAHRDVKPANILVECWRSNRVHLKLADFGLSKQSDDLRSFCGTAHYIAPEIFCAHLANSKTPKDAVKYDQLVDIWSLAVVLAWMECGELPEIGKMSEIQKNYEYSGNAWGDKMVQFVQGYQTPHVTHDLLSFVLEDMLVVDPEKRQPARICHKKALRLFGDAKSDDGEESGEERNPSTPRALSADVTSSSNDSAASEASTV